MVDLYPLEAFPVTLKPKTKRLFLLLGGLAALGLASLLFFSLLWESLIFFYTPSDLVNKHIPYGQTIRIGGIVVPQSLSQKGEILSFKLQDQKATLEVRYKGPLPELFREGQEIIAEGSFQGPALLEATSILAKHDEIYKPKAIEDPVSTTDKKR